MSLDIGKEKLIEFSHKLGFRRGSDVYRIGTHGKGSCFWHAVVYARYKWVREEPRNERFGLDLRRFIMHQAYSWHDFSWDNFFKKRTANKKLLREKKNLVLSDDGEESKWANFFMILYTGMILKTNILFINILGKMWHCGTLPATLYEKTVIVAWVNGVHFECVRVNGKYLLDTSSSTVQDIVKNYKQQCCVNGSCTLEDIQSEASDTEEDNL